MTKEFKIYSGADFIRDFQPRPQRGVECIAIADNEVECRAEPLDRVWWRGMQWAVTEYGIERLDGTYYIEKEDLLQDVGRCWPEHMARKVWVDVDEFATAWMVALALHGYGNRIDAEAIREMFGRLPPQRRAAVEG